MCFACEWMGAPEYEQTVLLGEAGWARFAFEPPDRFELGHKVDNAVEDCECGWQPEL